MAFAAATVPSRSTWRHEALPRALAAGIAIGAHLALAWLLFGIATAPPPLPPPQESVRMRLTLLPPAAPPMPVAPKEAPQPRPEQAATRQTRRPPAVQPPPVQRPTARPLPASPPLPQPAADALAHHPGTDPSAATADAPQAAEAAAPSSPPLPPAAQAAGTSDPNWEGKVLARLHQFRRYPRQARNRRQEGVAYVRARLDRQGRVLSATIRHGSGYALLDQEALQTFLRAQPLPRAPDTLPDPVEVDVPVEFFLR
ncbi:energy transducer TonB [Xanthomonas sacchari]|uniref:energy transducer TonB n=1 Tax=Xanthomonas sacchari TaxID=56458 RepID=UPI00266C6812|nr:energy transducer TonB [Xanthomonas sacchari]